MARETSELLHKISAVVSSSRTLDEMLGEIIGLAVRATGCDACLVYLLDPEADEIVLRASQVPHPSELNRLSMKLGEGVSGWVAEHRAVVALGRDAQSDPRFQRLPGLVEHTYEALLSVPLLSFGNVTGVVTVFHREAHEHSPEETALLSFIGEQLGVAISRAGLVDDKLRLERELETRKLVERAKGILHRAHGLSEEDAYSRLRTESRRTRRPIRELAEAIVLADQIAR